MFKAIGYFFGGLMYSIKQAFMSALGNFRFTSKFPYIERWGDPYEITGWMIRQCEQMLKPGDILLRRYNGALLSCFIPGRYSHSAIYAGDGVVIHALGDGVQKTDLIDFLRCDGYAILRCNRENAEEFAAKAVEIAKSYIGYDYDYEMNICEDYKNKEEVTKRTKSVYCHELTRSCYPELNIDPIAPMIWNGCIRSSKKQFLAQSFLDSEDLKLVWDSYYSEIRKAHNR